MIDFARPVDSFAKVRALVGHLVRNNRLQLRRSRVQQLRYLDVGCGPNPHPDLINLDYLWQPGIDLCWDLRRGLPLRDGAMKGIFSEHCLEHFPLPAALRLIGEFKRVLQPGGTLRLVVPDGELYLRNYVRHLDGDSSIPFPYPESSADGGSPITYVNRVFYQDRESPFGHCVMYDFALLRALLLSAGFAWVRRTDFRSGQDGVLLVDSESRRSESVYVEAGT